MTEYAINIGGSVWTGDYPEDQWVFPTYDDAAKAVEKMTLDDLIHGFKPPRRTIVEREVTGWTKATKPKKRKS